MCDSYKTYYYQARDDPQFYYKTVPIQKVYYFVTDYSKKVYTLRTRSYIKS